MLVELSIPWLIAVNILAWLAIHLGVAWAGTRLPVRYFRSEQWLYRARSWERDGGLYEGLFGIKRWKDRLPDGAALFSGGFRKAALRSASAEHLERFIAETCRGEAVHWIVFAAAVLFFLWNPWWAGLIMVAYALVANLPCILAQRYNRLRLARVLRQVRRREEGEAAAG